MGDHDEDLDLHPDSGEQLRQLEEYVARGDRMMNLLLSEITGKIRDPDQARSFNSTMEALQKDQEALRRKMTDLRKSEDDIEALTQAVDGLKMEKKHSMSRFISLMGKTEIPEEIGQSSKKSQDFEANLYFLFSRFCCLLPERKKEVNVYGEFKSSLRLLENKIALGIMDLSDAYEKKVGMFWSFKGEVEKGGRVNSLFNQFLENIKLVALLVEQSSGTAPDDSLSGDRIKECEAKQKEMKSNIQALKDYDEKPHSLLSSSSHKTKTATKFREARAEEILKEAGGDQHEEGSEEATDVLERSSHKKPRI